MGRAPDIQISNLVHFIHKTILGLFFLFLAMKSVNPQTGGGMSFADVLQMKYTVFGLIMS